ncbi:hypothetical protein ACP275_04G026300 [Erythranthe tilingii]
MAPNRRKGVNKAAAAAAARRKWKVGDLVLAKVKGFPAWPATVSEAERWGYPPDWKKVVVFFFGTEQIAFCNPADVEEFTEDKKVSLLGKRHGADFVRAVNEIIDCFEKLKKQDHVGGASGTDETNITNENNSDESLTKCVKDVAPAVADEPLSTGTANDLNSLTEAAVAAAAEDALYDEEMQLGQTSSNTVSTKTPVSTTCLAKSKTEGGRSRNSSSQRRKSARKLSSSKNDASRPRSTMLPSINNTRSSRRSIVNKRSLRRSRRIIKSSDDSEGQDADSLDVVSNDSIVDSDSEMMTVDSDMPSIQNGIRTGSKPVGVEAPLSENNERGTDLSHGLDLQSSNIIIKKKRRPSRKRHNNDIVETAKHDIVASDAEVLKNECVSPSFSEKSVERYGKDDGDEHLPLVKRARVRMGRPSPAADEEVTLLHKEEKTVEVPESLSMPSFDPLSCKVDALDDTESVPIKVDPALSSLSHVIHVKNPHLCEIRKNPVDMEAALPIRKNPVDMEATLPIRKNLVDVEAALPIRKNLADVEAALPIRKNLVDVEAALPPSKRLHRALEAMSANLAEDCQRASNCSPEANILSNGCCPPSSLECSELSVETKGAIKSKSGAVEILSNRNSPSGASELCIVSEVGMSGNDTESILVVSNCGNIHSIDGTNPELCRDSFENTEGADNKRLKLSSLNEVTAGIDAEHHFKQDTLGVAEQLAHSHCDSPGLAMFPTDHCKTEHLELNEASKGSDPCIQLDNAEGGGDETHKMKNLQLPEINQDSNKSEFLEEARLESLSSNITCSVAPVKVLNDGHHQFQFHSTSISHEHVDDRTISVTHSSSSLTDAPYSVARASPPSSSICNNTTLYSNKSLERNSCSPDVQLHLEKAKLAGKSSSKAGSLLSFEAIIRSLTRTKESIGRATRIAIDCAKIGFATKVVEILARNLESESSLHKKVDLFFLVDSIAQSSRGIKGDGGVYPSAIQALLPRLLLAAAPPGSSFHENHRQCLKVLRVWQERKIVPEPIIRHHIRELDSLCGSYPTIGSNRTLRSERPIDDPIRGMEGMQVDEYGSNSSIQLPGFCMLPMVRDDDGGSDSDGESFEAVTREHNLENFDGEKTQLVPAVEKRSHILEDVDGEIEMEDVAPCCDVEITSTVNNTEADHTRMSHFPSDNHYGAPFTHQQPRDVPLASAPLSRSSPPPPPPPSRPPHPLLPPVFPPAVHNSVSNGPDSKSYSSSQNLNSNMQKPMTNQSVFSRLKPMPMDDVHHHRIHENKDFEAQLPRQMPASSSACSFSNRSTSRSSGRDSNSIQPNDAFGKGYHLPPPHPAPSNQFSYVQEQRTQSRRDIPPPSHPNRFHSRNTEDANFYRDRDINKFGRRDNIGECWRPPFPSISGPCYPDDARMSHAPASYNGPPREPPLPNSKWDYPSRPVNHKHFHPYKPPSKGPIPVENRGPNFWRPR